MHVASCSYFDKLRLKIFKYWWYKYKTKLFVLKITTIVRLLIFSFVIKSLKFLDYTSMLIR
jgi:hypothetical protein